MTSIRRAAVACAALLAGTVVIVAPAQAATSMSISWSLPSGKSYGIGLDHIATNGTSPGGYEQYYEYPTSVYNNNKILPNPIPVSSATTLSEVRVEIYQSPTGQLFNALDGDGAVAIRVPAGTSKNIGGITFPALGGANTGTFTGDVRSRSSIANGRVRFEIFQLTGQPLSTTGYPLDAFTAVNSVGASYRTGPLWNGQYIAFITDTATGRQAVGLIDLAGTTRFDVDLDMVCFGIDECQWAGTVPEAGGEFHALPPTRIVDTRLGLGIPSIVKPLDGRNSDPNPDKRLASRLNHEFVVAGRGGVPAVGVSAVLLNVTVTGGTSGGSLRLFPKPPRTSVFADQSSFSTSNNQAAALWWTGSEARASLQLVEVGVGGRIRLDNVSFGDVHVIVDVVGWVDESQPGQDGGRLLTVAPSRFLDSRAGIGGPQAKFGTREARTLQVAGRDGIPADADSVVGTLTAVRAEGRSYQTVWPGTGTMPTASVLNTVAAQVRPNLVAVAPGASDEWSIYNNEFATDLLFDAVGYFTPATGSGGDITAVASASVYGPTTLGAGADVSIPVTNRAGVPASGVSAVWVLLTATSGSTQGYLTAYADGAARPTASNLNWVAGQSAANLALVKVGANGSIRVFNGNGSVSMAVSVVGWVS